MANQADITTGATRRGFLSGAAGLAAGGAVLALTTIPAVAVEPDPIFADGMRMARPMKYKNEAILARVEEMVEFLRTCYVRDGWKIDEEGAERVLSYFRRHVDGPAFADEDEDTAAYQQALEFFRSHGQSIDWVHDGNPIGMICGGAHHSPRAAELASAIDGELVEAYRQIVALDAEIDHYCTTISDDDRYEHQGYLAAEDARYEAIALLSETPASSWKGANAKAAVIKMRQIQHDYESTRALAESLADDVMQFAAAGV